MILGIDIGNSNIVAALIDETGVIKQVRYKTDKENMNLYHEENLKELLENQFVDEAIISSVVPEINETIKKIIEKMLSITPIFVGLDINIGIDIKCDNPRELGADLISAAVGAVAKYNGPVIIVDIGTATTFSVINSKREYLGGMIAAGPRISMKALASMASQLEEIDMIPIDKSIGTNTVDCIRIGTLTAQAAMIDGMIERVIKELNEPNTKIIATGGETEKIIKMCNQEIIVEKDIIFDGLYEIYKMNLR